MSRRHSVAAIVAALSIVSVAVSSTAERLPLALPSTFDRAAPSPAIEQTRYQPGRGVTLPRVLKEVKPEYTQEALSRRIEGTVWIEMVVQPSGEPSDMEITRSLDARYGLDDAALRAASEWRFAPGEKDGKPVPVVITLELTFTLK